MILLRNSFQRNTGDLGGSDLPVEMRNLFLQTATKKIWGCVFGLLIFRSPSLQPKWI